MAKSGTTLVIDIDSASVGVCVVNKLADQGVEKPIITLVKRVPVGTGAQREPRALIPLLKESLKVLLAEYSKQNPREIQIVVAAPWFSATLRTLSSKSEKPVRVSQSTVTRVVTEYRKSEHDQPGMQTLESVPIAVTVNGYRTLLEKTVSGKTLAVTLYESVADGEFVKTVAESVHALFPRATVAWHSTPLVYAETLLQLSGHEHGTVVDVGGELTDVSVLSHRAVAFVGSVPEGSRSLARAAATAFAGGQGEGSLADSASRLSMFARGELADKDMVATAAVLTEVGKNWQKGFNEILSEAGNTVPVLHKVFLVGERDELGWFSRIVADSAAHPNAAPVVVTPEFFNGALAFGEGGVYDASLALAVLFFHMRGGGHHKKTETPPVLYSIQ